MPLFRSLLSATILRQHVWPHAWRLAGAAGAVAQTTPASPPRPPPSRMRSARRSRAIIRDYLVKNPEVLQEAIAERERRQQETQKLAQSAALKESREALVELAPRRRRRQSRRATSRWSSSSTTIAATAEGALPTCRP